jgi:RNA polymerase primary sigma factor
MAGRSTLPGDHDTAIRGQRARRTFIESNIGLVLSIANKMRAPDHVDREDMIQDGMIGLERAVDKFEWRKGYKFSTYATWWIRQGIQRGMENTASTVRVPAHRSYELHGALAAVDGDYARLPDKLAYIAAITATASLDQPQMDGDATVGDTIAGAAPLPDETVVRQDLQSAVHGLLDNLDATTRYALERRFGLQGHDQSTFAEIGIELGVGAEAVRRRVQRALKILRGPALAIAA